MSICRAGLTSVPSTQDWIIWLQEPWTLRFAAELPAYIFLLIQALHAQQVLSAGKGGGPAPPSTGMLSSAACRRLEQMEWVVPGWTSSTGWEGWPGK